MPLYDFRCELGHVTERLCGSEIRLATCPCGETAERVPVNMVAIRGETVALDSTTTRNKFRLFQEAGQELEYGYAKEAAQLERPVKAPDLWGQAKRRAGQMIAAGEAPQPVVSN